MKKITISFNLEDIKDYETLENKDKMCNWLHHFLRDINVLCPYTSGDDEIKNLEIKVEEVNNEK